MAGAVIGSALAPAESSIGDHEGADNPPRTIVAESSARQ
jgi:hypothetical protein